MKQVAAVSAGVFLFVIAAAAPMRAQFAVYDPANYAEAVLQYEQMIRHYEYLLHQAVRVPVDIASRYHGYSLDWTFHEPASVLYAQSLFAALNTGDGSAAAAYRRVTDALDVPLNVWSHVPTEVQQRLANTYSTIELQDSANRLAIDQIGLARSEGPLMLQNIRNVEHDINNPGDAFHSQTALLEKINAAAAMQLRVGEQTNQFILSSLEQQILDGKRRRDAEARLMNATIYQWRYGQTYGANLFSNTAADLDSWRSY